MKTWKNFFTRGRKLFKGGEYVFAEICTVCIHFFRILLFPMARIWFYLYLTWYLLIIFLIWGTQYLKVLSRETEALPSKYYGQRLEFRGGWPHNCIVCLLKKFRISGNEISFFLSRNSTTFCRQCVSKFDIFVNVFEFWISNHLKWEWGIW